MRNFIAALWTRLFLLIVAFCVFASWPALAQTSSSTQEGSLTLANHTPAKVLNGTATLVSHYNPAQMLRLVLTVQPPNMAGEEQFIKALVTKGSPGFHKFLTPDEWNTRFGPAVEDEQAVVDWAQSVGLTVTKRYPNRLLVEVEGTAGTIEKAFGVTINNYQVGDEVDFSNDRDPVIPVSLSGILHFVTGLSNVERPHRIGSRHATKKGADYVPGPAISEAESLQGAGDPTKAPWSRPAAITSRAAAKSNVSGAPSKPKANDNYPLDYMSGTYAMDPDNVQSSNGYDYNALQRLSFCCNQPGLSGGSPPESSIALVGYGGFNSSDVVTFFNNYGMAYDINAYCIGGSPCPGNDGEAPLDVEYSAAMSNSYGSYLDTAHIYEYEMTNSLYTTYEAAFNDVMNDGHAKVVSTSYGWEENVGFSGTVATGTMHPIFNNMIGVGITLIAASGDNGASDGCGNATAVDYPSSDPDFIAAGGTQLNMYTNGVFYSETAWQGESWKGACGSNHGGSTGGVSVLFAAPSWQTSETSSTYPTGVVSPFYLWKNGSEYVETGNANRMVPDIALTANPDVLGEWYYSGGSWQDEGGTSIVAPELAGFFAQENSYLDYIGDKCGSGGTSACSPVGLASPFFYYNAIAGAQHNPFYDMLSGCSNNDITAADSLFYFCAYAGYDPITGWGSANMMQLAWGINWEIIPADGAPSLALYGPATSTWFNTDQIIDWDLTDGSSNGYTPPGIAGFTLAWDSIPSDSYSEPHGGDGDTFYTGPDYTYSGFGCVDNDGSSCEAASGQGCHTVYVRGWDNQGVVTNSSYGPVCFDSVPPTIGASTNPPTSGTVWVNKPVVVTLMANDPGGSGASGIKKTYYAIDTGSCYPGSLSPCKVYSAPFTMSAQGQNYVYFFTEDKAGNFSSEPYIWVSIDTTKPVTTATLNGTLNGSNYQNSVQVTLSASDSGGSGLANTFYQVDGGSLTTYSGAFTVSQNGLNTVKFYSTDNAGNIESTKTVSFGITDTTTTGLTSSLNPSGSGKVVKFTAAVTPVSGTVTGSVTFKDGATVLGTTAVSGGKAILSTSKLAGGSHSITASYLGSTYFVASASGALTQVVENDSATVISSSANPAEYGESVTLTATIAYGGPVPTGTVTFKAGTVILATATVSGTGTATYTSSSFTVASHAITAVYSGDSNYVGSTSAVFSQVVHKATTSTSVGSSLNPSTVGESVTFTATVNSVAPGVGTPVGTVKFYNGATLLGSKVLTAGVAAFATTKLPAGNPDDITAVYVGNADYATSTSPVLLQTVNP